MNLLVLLHLGEVSADRCGLARWARHTGNGAGLPSRPGEPAHMAGAIVRLHYSGRISRVLQTIYVAAEMG